MGVAAASADLVFEQGGRFRRFGLDVLSGTGHPTSAQPAPWGPTLTPVTGVFGSVCLGRGRHFYGGQTNFETTALTAALPPGTPIVGLFANGALHDGVNTKIWTSMLFAAIVCVRASGQTSGNHEASRHVALRRKLAGSVADACLDVICQ